MKVEVVGVEDDNIDEAEWGVLVDGQLCTPRWRQEGPAVAYAAAIENGTRKPEFISNLTEGVLIKHPNREVIMLMTWRAALRLEQKGIMVMRGRKVSSIAKTYLGIKHRITIPDLKKVIDAKLVELGYPERDRAGNY